MFGSHKEIKKRKKNVKKNKFFFSYMVSLKKIGKKIKYLYNQLEIHTLKLFNLYMKEEK